MCGTALLIKRYEYIYHVISTNITIGTDNVFTDGGSKQMR